MAGAAEEIDSDAWSNSGEEGAAETTCSSHAQDRGANGNEGAAAITAPADSPSLADGDRDWLQMRTGPNSAEEAARAVTKADDDSSDDASAEPLAVQVARQQVSREELDGLLARIDRRGEAQSEEEEAGAETTTTHSEENAASQDAQQTSESHEAELEEGSPQAQEIVPAADEAAQPEDTDVLSSTVTPDVRDSLIKRLNNEAFKPPTVEGKSGLAAYECAVSAFPMGEVQGTASEAFIVLAPSISRVRASRVNFNRLAADMIVESGGLQLVCTGLVLLHAQTAGTQFPLGRLTGGVASTKEWQAVLYHQALGEMCTLQVVATRAASPPPPPHGRLYPR